MSSRYSPPQRQAGLIMVAVFTTAALALAYLYTGGSSHAATTPISRLMRPAQLFVQSTAGTPTFEPVPIPTVIVKEGVYRLAGQGAFPFADAAFDDLWEAGDGATLREGLSRPWGWGPGPNTRGLVEPYKDDPTGLGQRLVQYYDKSRMELNDPGADPRSPFYVTNGLLTVELVSGLVQTGQDTFQPFRPACIPVTGDQGDTTAPSYAALGRLSNSRLGDHPTPDRTGVRVTETVDRAANVASNNALGQYAGVDLVHYEPATRHNVPRVFWDFLNGVKGLSGSAPASAPAQGQPWYFASGLPISEPYWARASISGREKSVLVQLYERRALTYVPENAPEWQVEMANIGQHYFDWRYRNLGVCLGQEGLVGTPSPPMLAPTPLPTPQLTPTAPICPGPQAAVDIVAYIDNNNNRIADEGEVLRDFRVVLIHQQTNSVFLRDRTDRNGHVHIEWCWSGTVNVYLPDVNWTGSIEPGQLDNTYSLRSGSWRSKDDASLYLPARFNPISLPAVIP